MVQRSKGAEWGPPPSTVQQLPHMWSSEKGEGYGLEAHGLHYCSRGYNPYHWRNKNKNKTTQAPKSECKFGAMNPSLRHLEEGGFQIPSECRGSHS